VVNANTQGKSEGDITGLICPECGQLLIKVEGECDCEFTCINPECRGSEMKYPTYYGYTQEDIDSNVGD